jgi:DNA polymerase I-like protein with 3'-5' exonuclease and polymerase domains
MDETYTILDRDHQIVYPEFGYVKRMDLLPEWLQFKDPKAYEGQFRAAKRRCLNALIQGCSAFIVKKALVEIAQDFRAEHLDAQVLYPIHDEVGALVRIEQRPFR